MKKLLMFSAFILMVSDLSAQGFATYPNSISGSHIRSSIEIDNAGNKWYSSLTKGLYKFDGTTWFTYNITNSAIPTNFITDIDFDAANVLWASSRAGLVKFDGTTWTTYNVSNSGIANDTLNCVFINGSNVWAGTKQGLVMFDGLAWTTYNTSNSGIVANNITAINIDVSGNLWVGTSTGLSVKTSSGWLTYNASNNFVSDQVTGIVFETAVKTWISTKTSGLFKFENGTIIPISSIGMELDMTPPNTVNALSKGPQGGVLFYGTRGVPAVYGFYEIAGSQTYFYPFPSGYVSNFHAIDASNVVWFAGLSSGTANSIYSFDYASFTGTVNISAKPGVEFLNINQVRAGVMNRGDMHWDLSQSMYEVPKNSGRKTIFASSLWIGGLDAGNNLHQAAMTYRQTGNDYWPGPLDTITGTTDSSTSAMYDKIWKLDRWQIDEFRTMFANGSVTAGTYIPAYNIVNWPAHGGGNYTRNMAPFVDVNGDGNYDPLGAGDYPKIKGDQMCYWIFNDNLNVHSETGGQPLMVEVHASAYAYNCDSLSDSLKALNYTTFYDYDIFNRSSFSYHDVYVSLWQDGDIGEYSDDYVGCNRNGNYSFQYNADNHDESLSGILAYGSNPPMYSNVILNGPLAPSSDGVDNDNDGTTDEAGERNLMTNVLNYNNNSHPINGNPYATTHFYNYMRSKWLDGSPTVYGGDGTGTGSAYNFMFDGVPGPVGWSEVSENNPSIDRKVVTSCGPFDFAPSQMVNFAAAIVFTRDDNPVYSINNLYNRNQYDVETIRQWYANDNFPSCDPQVSTGIADSEPSENTLEIYPNPTNDLLNINYKAIANDISIEIYDVRGQLLKSVKMRNQAANVISVSDLSSGLYLLKVNNGKNAEVKRFVKQ